jgi:hypothetical protein
VLQTVTLSRIFMRKEVTPAARESSFIRYKPLQIQKRLATAGIIEGFLNLKYGFDSRPGHFRDACGRHAHASVFRRRWLLSSTRLCVG